MWDLTILLADTADQVAKAAEALSRGEIAGIITAIGGVLGTLGFGARWFLGWLMQRIGEIRTDFKEQLATKDTQIDDLSKKLSAKSDQHASDIERLLNATIEKVEGFASQNAEMYERGVEQQAEVAAILRTFEVRLQKPPESG